MHSVVSKTSALCYSTDTGKKNKTIACKKIIIT